jgi:hypothetical protein
VNIYNNPYQNYQPYNGFQSYQNQRQMLPKYEIIRVNGENGARAFQMAENSSVLLLDESAPLVWLCQSDGAGYKTVTPYQIQPYAVQKEADLRTLEERIKKLEERLNESNFENVNAEPKQ